MPPKTGNLSKTDEAGVVFERLQKKLLLLYQQIYKICKKTCILGKKVLYSNQASVK